MRERAKELKAAATRAEEAEACQASIASMREADRAIAKRVHAIITEAAPSIAPKTWYCMPAYALENSYQGDGLGETWNSQLRRSSFIGTFNVR